MVDENFDRQANWLNTFLNVDLNLDTEGGSNYRRGAQVTKSAGRLTECCN
jgi:hypothetical protein